MGCSGGALGAPLWVALLSVLSRSQWNEEWNDLSSIVLPPLGWVHGGLGR
jgi:hypothetical protein